MSDPIMTPTDTTKPGWRTTEFWLVLSVVVCATVLVETDKLAPDWWTGIVGALVGVYTGVRGFVKY